MHIDIFTCAVYLYVYLGVYLNMYIYIFGVVYAAPMMQLQRGAGGQDLASRSMSVADLLSFWEKIPEVRAMSGACIWLV